MVGTPVLSRQPGSNIKVHLGLDAQLWVARGFKWPPFYDI
jgi:hypothetical protein